MACKPAIKSLFSVLILLQIKMTKTKKKSSEKSDEKSDDPETQVTQPTIDQFTTSEENMEEASQPLFSGTADNVTNEENMEHVPGTWADRSADLEEQGSKLPEHVEPIPDTLAQLSQSGVHFVTVPNHMWSVNGWNAKLQKKLSVSLDRYRVHKSGYLRRF